MSNLFAVLQDSAAARLEQAEWLGGATPPVSVVVEHAGDVGSQIEERIARRGLAVIVSSPSLGRRGDNLSEGLDVTLGVTIVEAPKLNRGSTGTRKNYDQAALEVIALLEGFVPGPGWQALRFQSGDLAAGGDSDEIVYEMEFSTVVRVGVITT